MERFTEVRITNPLLNTAPNGEQYYIYGIDIQTNDPAFSRKHSLTWRRYSEFCWLRKILKDNTYNTDVQIPDLPPKGIWYFQNQSDPAFLKHRRCGLKKFMKQILEIPLCKSDKALHLFIQTSISTSDILQNILGKKHDKIQTEEDVPSLSIYEYNRIGRIRKSLPKEVNGNNNSESKSTSSSPNDSLPSSIKKVTFSEKVRIVILENALSTGTL